MTYEKLSAIITDRMIQKNEIRKHRSVQDVRRDDIVSICAGFQKIINLYQESNSYDPIKSFEARAILWDAMNNYDVTDDEVENHEIFKK
jgi:hypothetical protein